MKKRTFSNAYDAYWFLVGHPRLKCARFEIFTEQDYKYNNYSQMIAMPEVDHSGKRTGKIFQVIKHKHSDLVAIEANLDIFYTKVDKTHRVNNDKTKNEFVECWLECGPMKPIIREGVLSIEHYHDTNLDCGAPTFDAALVKLARLALKYYGDYRR